MNKIRVAIVEDKASYRESLADLIELNEGYALVVAVESMEDYLWQTRGLEPPDILLLDVDLPGMSGISGIPMVLERSRETRIVMLTVYQDWDVIFAALKAGAKGYLLKSTPFEQLNTYITSLLQGGAPMSPEIAAKVVDYFNPSPKRKQASPLSEREQEVVTAILDGLSYKEIAGRLCISIGTVYSHINKIYRKLEVHSKVELINKSKRQGLVD